MVPARTSHAVLVILAAMSVGLLALVAAPFATSLFIAAVLAGAFAPWHARLAALLGQRPGASAGLLTAAVIVAVVGPFSALGAVVVPQIAAGFAWLRQALQADGLAGLVQKLPAFVQPLAERTRADLPASLDRLQQIATAEGGRAAAVLGNLLSATGSFLF